MAIDSRISGASVQMMIDQRREIYMFRIPIDDGLNETSLPF